MEQTEKEEGLELEWFTLDDAINQLKNDRPRNHEGEFVRQRDLAFLEEAKKLI